MSDQESPDAPKVPSRADFQQKDAVQLLEDAVEQALHDYASRHATTTKNASLDFHGTRQA
jgi:hypothetical protein